MVTYLHSVYINIVTKAAMTTITIRMSPEIKRPMENMGTLIEVKLQEKLL